MQRVNGSITGRQLIFDWSGIGLGELGSGAGGMYFGEDIVSHGGSSSRNIPRLAQLTMCQHALQGGNWFIHTVGSVLGLRFGV